ncbi:MAG: hypothetical protein ABW098_16680 [Candidatus Thiodiazotropha sp.]
MIFISDDYSKMAAVLTLLFTLGVLPPAEAADFEPLEEIALMGLVENHKTMQQLAPQLRMQLRVVRMGMKFDIREIHNIERSIEKALKDVERVIAMHNSSRINSIRARFLVDDLRRKAAALEQGLAHVSQQITSKYNLTEEVELKDTAASEEDVRLLSLLQNYTQLVTQSLELVSPQIQ